MTYIYLNTYANGYLYVGIHKWSGEGLDPNYHGSSSVAAKYGWLPIKEEILEITKDPKREHFWIEYYADKFGIAPVARQFSHNNLWVKQFNEGLCINMHSCDASNTKSSESRKKMVQTQKKNSSFQRFQELGRLSCHTKEAWIKRNKSRNSNPKWTKHIRESLTVEVLENRHKSQVDSGGFHKCILSSQTTSAKHKRSITRHNNFLNTTNYGKHHLILEETTGYEGTIVGVLRNIRHPNWEMFIHRRIKQGLSVIERGGYKFIVKR